MGRIDANVRDMAGDEIEVELKLELDCNAAARLADTPALAGLAFEDRAQSATYYDTPDQDLRAAGVSLRVRRVGAAHVQTIKAGGTVAAGLFARPEWERDVAGPQPELETASPIRTLVEDAVLERIAPAFTVAVTRRQWLVEHDGATLELVVDTGTVSVGDRSTPVSEIELELKSGPPAAIFALARALGRDARLRLGVLTKAERGYRLIDAADAPAIKAERLDLNQDATVAEAFAAIVGTCLRQFRLNEDALRREPTTGAIHQARVALRRLRSALSILKPIVGDGRFAHLAGELRWLAGTLGAARDLDVLIDRVDGGATEPLVAAREDAYATALAALDSQRARDLMIDLVEWTALGDWRRQPADPDLPGQRADRFAAHVLRRLRRRIKRRGRDLARLDDEERHRVRIEAKKLRYATGFFEMLFRGKKERQRHKAFLKALETLQDHLGILNDLATAPALLARYGLDEQAAAAAGQRNALLRDAAKAHQALKKAKRFW
ncbi:CHAD domain-containing protein [uncultured Sphingomonas sp.]|uniref:CYTH and CHAD domain-containing protein n=1 Tax=uncultured Sphingomonas sp. TaxID=158754 RepID=UPI0025ED40FC|nr:CHAD domain-containing protein [uncultured Sphingomonas sp.]